jgi:DNA-binding ferritin-like protein (Dps family)
MNKKGMSQITDIVMSLILFTVFFAIIMIMGGSRLMTVYATVEAANTAIICQNDINAVMEFPSDDKTIKDVLVEDYLEEDYATFETEISKYLNTHTPKEGNWKITLFQEDILLYEFGEIADKKNAQACNYFVALPCDTNKCVMEVQLEITQNE